MSVEAGSVKLEEGMAVIRIPLSEVHGLRVAFLIDGEPVSWNETTGEVEKYRVLRFRDGSGIDGNYDPALSAFTSLWTAANACRTKPHSCRSGVILRTRISPRYSPEARILMFRSRCAAAWFATSLAI